MQEKNYAIQQYKDWLKQLKDGTKKINVLLAKELDIQRKERRV